MDAVASLPAVPAAEKLRTSNRLAEDRDEASIMIKHGSDTAN
jgi:hypothetical protein